MGSEKSQGIFVEGEDWGPLNLPTGFFYASLPCAPEVFFPQSFFAPGKITADNVPEKFRPQRQVLYLGFFEVKTSFQEGLGDFFLAY